MFDIAFTSTENYLCDIDQQDVNFIMLNEC